VKEVLVPSHIPEEIGTKWFSNLNAVLFSHFNFSGTISVAFIDAKEMERLNKTYRGKESVTDVLSFPFKDLIAEGGDMGEIVLCLTVLKERASAQKIAVQEQAQRLVIHGVLHILGRDHTSDKQADAMEVEEEELFEEFHRSLSES